MTSICIFGSRARNTSDALSDRDLLLISETESPNVRLKDFWKNNGWNVTTFSRSSFLKMVETKALFVQHLKQEGKIIRDDDCFLATVLNGFFPKNNYDPEKQDAINQLSNFPAPYGDYWPDLCIGDIMYVFFRNIAVLHLASMGRYVFDFRSLVSIIARDLHLDHSQRKALIKLREIKYAYRKRQATASALSWLPTARDATKLVASALRKPGLSGIRDGATTDRYYCLRKTELTLVKKFDPRWLDELQPYDEVYAQWRLICGSRGYPKQAITRYQSAVCHNNKNIMSSCVPPGFMV